MKFSITGLVDRLASVRLAEVTPNVKQRIQAAADEMSVGADDGQHVEILNEALIAVTVFVYTAPAFDGRTFRILCPLPWGRSGWRRWGLRSWEASILRAILDVRSANQRHGAALFDYSPDSRLWFIDLEKYPTLEAALAYLKAYPVTVKEFQTHATAQRQQAAARMKKNRENQRANV